MSIQPPNGFSKIIVAVDGSPSSQAACETAAEIARSFGSHVTILNAVSQDASASSSATAAATTTATDTTPPAGGGGGGGHSKAVAKSQDILDRAAAVFQSAGVAVFEKKTAQGSSSAVETIIDYAGKEGS